MTIQEIQENAREFAPIFKDKTPEQRMLYLTTEMGEIALEVLKLSGFRQGGNTDELKENLGMEIYDVVWNLCDLANMFDIDLEDAFGKKVKGHCSFVITKNKPKTERNSLFCIV